MEASSGVAPRNENALEVLLPSSLALSLYLFQANIDQNLTGFLNAAFAKKYTNPSADIIELLAGLDAIDRLVSDLVNGLDAIIRQTGRRQFREKAIGTALAIVAGAYQTTLVSYFIHRDLFPSLMKIGSSQSKYVISPVRRRPSVDEVEDELESLVLLGLLANYNKFETQNPYQTRLDDFVNEEVMHRVARAMGAACRTIRQSYIAIQDDAPEGWSLNTTLAFVGLRALSPEPKTRKAPLTEDEMKDRYNAMPPLEASILLSLYSFVHANKLFASALVTLPVDQKSHESPFSSFLSAVSYIAHHAHRSIRARSYTLLNLFTLRILVEDPVILKRLTVPDPDGKCSIRLARQRPPYLPQITTPRIPTTAILDVATDTISHNLRRRLDTALYSQTLCILHRIISHLAHTKTRLSHHWPYIWAALLTLLRFLVTYHTDLLHLPAGGGGGVKQTVATPLTSLIAQCLSKGDLFLPDPASYDDLFYKLVEGGEVLQKFRDIYCPPAPPPPSHQHHHNNGGSTTENSPALLTRSIAALLSIASHYQSLLGSRKHQSPAAVSRVIKEGYDTLNLDDAAVIAADDDPEAGSGTGERYREVQWRGEVKRILRVVVEDARVLRMK